MSRTLASMLLAVGVAATTVGGAAAGPGDPTVPNEFVSGSGRIGDLRFTVTGHDATPEGATGQMTLLFPDGSEVRANVECISVVVPTAATLGTVQRSDVPGIEPGELLEFEMVDRGEPDEGLHDLFGFSFPTGPVACVFDGTGHNELEEGNIELKQEGFPGRP